MDSVEFEQLAREDPHRWAFLQEVAEKAGKQVSVEEPQRFATGVEIFIGIAAYALFRWAKDYFDHRRALNETEILRQQAQVITTLTQEDFPPELAQATVVKLLEGIAKRTKDDPVLQRALDLVGKGE